jgi:hypothetical protein
MEELYFKMIRILAVAVDDLTYGPQVSPEDEKTTIEFAGYLHTHLIGLNSVINTEFLFPDGTVKDIVDYFKILKEYEKDISDIVEYTLTQNISPDKYGKMFLEEVLEGIIYNSEEITKLIAKYDV